MRERGYHHGDLRNALLAATLEIVRDRGARGFSVSEAARRVGVSSSAPYRHFPDREAMLAAAAMVGFVELEQRFLDLSLPHDLGDAAAGLAIEYVRFARDDPARFEVMFAHGIDKNAYDGLLRQTERIQQGLEAVLHRHVQPATTARRAAELWALAHGVAELTIAGNVQHVLPEDQVAGLADSIARTWALGVADAQRRAVAAER